MTRRILASALLSVICLSAAAIAANSPWKMAAPTNFLTGYPALNEDGTVNVVVEIPAGTNAKWEATKAGDALEWGLEDFRRRVVDYLAYPANYGMVPRTRLPKEFGGDGDALDVVVLGPAVARGSVVAARPIGVLKLLDGGERDDKIVAIPLDGPFARVRDLADLDRDYPGVTSILETWFLHYKGPDRIRSEGRGDRADAAAVIRGASDSFEAEVVSPGRVPVSP